MATLAILSRWLLREVQQRFSSFRQIAADKPSQFPNNTLATFGQSTTPMYRGYFINLDRNPSRRTAMEAQIAERGLADRYTRFPAADGVRLAQHHSTQLEPGNLGCWFSHTAILADNIGSGSHLHIMEDDTVLCRDAKQAFPALLRCASEMSPPWDILFTDVFTPFDLDLFRRFAPHVGEPESRNRGMLFDLKDITFAGTSSYFVNARSIEKYHRLMEGNWTSDLPIDLYVRRLVHSGQLIAHVTVPFLTAPSGHSSESDIRGRVDLSRRVSDIYRRSLFVDADLPALEKELEGLTRGTETRPIASLFLKACRFALSDRWETF